MYGFLSTQHDMTRHNMTWPDTTRHKSHSLHHILGSVDWWYSVNTPRHGTARHGTARHGTARHGTARHGTARHGTARHGTAQHNTSHTLSIISLVVLMILCQHTTARHGTARHGTAQYNPSHTLFITSLVVLTIVCQHTWHDTTRHDTTRHDTTWRDATEQSHSTTSLMLSVTQTTPHTAVSPQSKGRQNTFISISTCKTTEILTGRFLKSFLSCSKFLTSLRWNKNYNVHSTTKKQHIHLRVERHTCTHAVKFMNSLLHKILL